MSDKHEPMDEAAMGIKDALVAGWIVVENAIETDLGVMVAPEDFARLQAAHKRLESIPRDQERPKEPTARAWWMLPIAAVFGIWGLS